MNMVKELVLVRRVFFSILFTLWLEGLLPFEPSTLAISTTFGFIFIFSFIFQYQLIYLIMKGLQRNGRIITLGITVTVATIAVYLGIAGIRDINYNQEVEVIVHDFVKWMGITLNGMSLFVAATCTRKAFEKHNAL